MATTSKTTSVPPQVVDLLGDMAFLAAVRERGVSTEKKIKDLFKSAGISNGDFDQALRVFDEDVEQEARVGGERPPPGDCDKYAVVDGKLCAQKWVWNQKAEAWEQERAPICNFSAEIIREETRDDGVSSETAFVLKGHLPETKRTLPEIVVSAEELDRTTWAMSRWGSRVIVNSDTKPAELRAAIQTVSSAEGGTTYTHTGWRNIDGNSVYLHAGGALGMEGVRVTLSGATAAYLLPAKIVDPTEAVDYVLGFLKLADGTITYPLFAAMWRAPLQSELPVDAVVWPYGPTGQQKTSLIAQMMSTYGIRDRLGLTVNWSSTAASLENEMFLAKDAPLIIDDYAPSESDGFDEVRAKAKQVVRAVGNRASRGRMSADMTARADRPPRALVISTGEDLPTGTSILARTIPIPMRPKAVNLDLLSKAQRRVERAPHAMAAYIGWLAPRMQTLGSTLRERFADLRAEFQVEGAHARSPEGLAHLALGGQLFSEFAAHIGVFTEAEAKSFMIRTKSALAALGGDQRAIVSDSDVCNRFLRQLASLILQGKLRLESKLTLPLATVDGADSVGWRTSEHAYLEPSSVYRAVNAALRTNGQRLEVSETGLWKQLAHRGFLAEREGDHLTVKKSLGGSRPRVLAVRLEHLDLLPVGDGGEGAAGGSGGGERTSLLADTGKKPGQAATESGQSRPDSGPPTARSFVQQEELQTLRTDREDYCPDCPTAPPPGALRHERPAEDGGDRALLFSETSAPPLPLGNRGTGAPGQEAAWLEQFEPARLTDRDLCALEQAEKFTFIRDAGDLDRVATEVAEAGTVALDLETTGLSPLDHHPRLLQLGLPDGQVYVVDLFATGGIGGVGLALCGVVVVGHNLQFDLGFLQHHFGIRPDRAWDCMVASRLLDASEHLHEKGFHGLRSVLSRYLEVELSKEQQASDWSGALTGEQLRYAAADVRHLLALRARLASDLEVRGLAEVFDLECGLLPVVAAMELAGVGFDTGAWTALVASYTREADALERSLTLALGIENVRSPKQLVAGLKSIGIATEETNSEALAAHASHPVVRDLQRYRTLRGFISNSGERVMAASGTSPDGRVHASFNPMAAPTGRWGCSNPNLLALPKTQDVRACVVPAEGHVLVVADYAAIELRVLAHITQDPLLTQVFRDGGDPHRLTASLVLGKSPDEVTKEERQSAKAINFGFAFGMGAGSFVSYALENYGVTLTRPEAAAFRCAYLAAYGGIANWQRQTKAAMPLEVRSASGRTWAFPDRVRGYTQRLNMPVQGTAADGLKAAIVLLDPRLRDLNARLLLAVHDELVVEVPTARAEEALAAVEEAMRAGMERFVTTVPIRVEASVRTTWAA